jgi:hypothetical protein
MKKKLGNAVLKEQKKNKIHTTKIHSSPCVGLEIDIHTEK